MSVEAINRGYRSLDDFSLERVDVEGVRPQELQHGRALRAYI